MIRMRGLMSNYKIKPLTKSLGPFFQKKWSKTTRKQFLCCFFAIGAPPNGPREVPKGPQVGGMYGPMSKNENKPQPKPLDHSYKRNGPKQPEKSLLCCFWLFWGQFGIPKEAQKGMQKNCK